MGKRTKEIKRRNRKKRKRKGRKKEKTGADLVYYLLCILYMVGMN